MTLSSKSTAVSPERDNTAPQAQHTQCSIPWCILDHSDTVHVGDCHLGPLDFASGLGVGIGQSDDSPFRVEIGWDWTATPEMLYWTPRQAREVAQRLLQLADMVEDTEVSAR